MSKKYSIKAFRHEEKEDDLSMDAIHGLRNEGWVIESMNGKGVMGFCARCDKPIFALEPHYSDSECHICEECCKHLKLWNDRKVLLWNPKNHESKR